MHLEHLECRLNQVTEVCGLPLAVVDFVTQVVVFDFEQVQHRQDLAIVGDKCLSDSVRARYKCLQYLECY